MTNRKRGQLCEQYAKNYLTENGFDILDMNFSCREGEIDIVAKEAEYTVFVEVKARKNTLYGMPCEAVTPSKMKKIILAANRYIQTYNINSALRFDVIEILYLPKGEDIEVIDINHIRSAFDAG